MFSLRNKKNIMWIPPLICSYGTDTVFTLNIQTPYLLRPNCLVINLNRSILLVHVSLDVPWGWSGGAKVSCILCHRGVQLILAYSWARPAILVAGKGREVMFLFLLFLHFHSCSSFFPVPLFHLFCYLFCLFSPFLWETTQNDPQGLTCR